MTLGTVAASGASPQITRIRAAFSKQPKVHNSASHLHAICCRPGPLAADGGAVFSATRDPSHRGAKQTHHPSKRRLTELDPPKQDKPDRCHHRDMAKGRSGLESSFPERAANEEDASEAKPLSRSTGHPILSEYDVLVNLVFPQIYKKRKGLYDAASIQRRIIDYAWRDSHTDKRFTQKANFVDAIRDIPVSSNKARLFKDSFTIEGQSAIYPLSSPIIQEWFKWIDYGLLNPDLVFIYSIFNNSQYYDGCIVAEFLDYRNTDLDVKISLGGSYSSDPAGVKTREDGHDSAGEERVSYHRVLLQPTEASFLADMLMLMNDLYGEGKWDDNLYLEIESKIRHAIMPPICIDPSPRVCRLLNFFHFQAQKYRLQGAFSYDPWVLAAQHRGAEDSAKNSHEEHATSALKYHQSAQSFKFKRFHFVEQIRNHRRISDSEYFTGLDTKKALSSVSKVYWNVPVSRIYRTVRLERDAASSGVTSGIVYCYSLNVVVTEDAAPEVILRIGRKMDTSEGGETLRFRLSSPLIIEAYIASFKKCIMMQDSRIVCFTDLTNSSVWPLFSGTHLKSTFAAPSSTHLLHHLAR